jgi:hypothetical protein
MTETSAEMLTRMRHRASELEAENYCLRHRPRSMRYIKNPAIWLMAILALCVLALTIYLCALIAAARHTVEILPDELLATINSQATAARLDTLALIDRQASGIRRESTVQLNALRTQSLARIDALAATADRQITSTRADLEVTILRSLNTLVAPINGIRTDLQPVLQNAAALTKDAQDSWDDSYDDVRGLLESSTVAATQVAQTAETVRAAAPQLATDVTGIASDFHDATHNLDIRFFHPPAMTKKQKVAAFFGNFEALAIAALRGGVL